MLCHKVARLAAEIGFYPVVLQKVLNRKPATRQKVDAKSIARCWGLGLARGQNLLITARGSDEQQAVDALAQLIDNGLKA